MSKLLTSVDWLSMDDNLKRLNVQKKLLNKYTPSVQHQIINELDNGYYIHQIAKLLLKHINHLKNHCYHLELNNKLSYDEKAHISHIVNTESTVFDLMNEIGQPLNDTPCAKKDVDSGNFVKRLIAYNQQTIESYRHHFFSHFRTSIKWMDFLRNLDKAKINSFSKNTKAFQSAYLNDAQNNFSMRL